MKKILRNADGTISFLAHNGEEFIPVVMGPLWGTQGLQGEFPEIGYAYLHDVPNGTPRIVCHHGTRSGLYTTHQSNGTQILWTGVVADPQVGRGGDMYNKYRSRFVLRQWPDDGAVKVTLDSL